MARLDWSRTAEDLDRLIRGCDPQPAAHSQWRDRTLRLFDGRRIEGEVSAEPGTIVSADENGRVVAAKGGRIAVGRVRVGEGKKLPAASVGLTVGERLD